MIYEDQLEDWEGHTIVSGKQGHFDAHPSIACDSQHVWLVNAPIGGEAPLSS